MRSSNHPLVIAGSFIIYTFLPQNAVYVDPPETDPTFTIEIPDVKLKYNRFLMENHFYH